jgi:hypothetical protein
MPLAVSHRTLTPSTTTGCMDSTVVLMAESVSEQVSLFAAMVRKSMRPSKAAPPLHMKVERSLTCLPVGRRPETRRLFYTGHSQGRRRRCRRPRQHVRNHVVRTGDMADVAGMLGDVAELPALPGSPWI